MKLNYFPKILSLIFCLSMSKPCLSQEAWNLVKDKDGIKIYTRSVTGKKLKDLKTTSNFSATAHSFVALLSDISAQSRYLYGCLKSVELEKTKANERTFYQQSYMPWPFTNRDGVFVQKIYHVKQSKLITVETESRSGFLADSANHVRIPSLKASWHITINPDSTLTGEYQISVDPGGSVPAWLVNMFIDEAPYQTILKMKTLLTEKKYKEAKVGFLTD